MDKGGSDCVDDGGHENAFDGAGGSASAVFEAVDLVEAGGEHAEGAVGESITGSLGGWGDG